MGRSFYKHLVSKLSTATQITVGSFSGNYECAHLMADALVTFDLTTDGHPNIAIHSAVPLAWI